MLVLMVTTTWTCNCGDVVLDVTPKGGTRVVCYCESCRGFVARLGADSILDDWGGNDLFQVAPEAAVFMSGADKLAWTKMTDKGPARWFTTCCKTPLANTLETRTVPFLTLQSAYFDTQDDLPPIEIRVSKSGAKGRVPKSNGGMGRLLRQFAVRSLKSRITGGWRRNPLFDGAGQPIAAQVPLPASGSTPDAR